LPGFVPGRAPAVRKPARISPGTRRGSASSTKTNWLEGSTEDGATECDCTKACWFRCWQLVGPGQDGALANCVLTKSELRSYL